MFKFKGQIIHAGPIGRYTLNSNWNNSMQAFYPTVSIFWVNPTGAVEHQTYALAGDLNEAELGRSIEVTLDKAQQDAFEAIEDAKARERAEVERVAELKVVKRGREVRVIKGRKYPIGMVGRVFWVGENNYGRSAGIETADGKRVFVSTANLEVIGEG